MRVSGCVCVRARVHIAPGVLVLRCVPEFRHGSYSKSLVYPFQQLHNHAEGSGCDGSGIFDKQAGNRVGEWSHLDVAAFGCGIPKVHRDDLWLVVPILH